MGARSRYRSTSGWKNDTTTTVAHAAEMIRELAGWLPDRKLHLCADGAYASLAGADLPRTQVTS